MRPSNVRVENVVNDVSLKVKLASGRHLSYDIIWVFVAVRNYVHAVRSGLIILINRFLNILKI